MDRVELNHNGDCIENTSVEWLVFSDSSEACNVLGDIEVRPRVGDSYQAEIPPLITESDYLLYKKNPFEQGFMLATPCDFLMGSSIPIMRINKEDVYMKHEMQESLGDSNSSSNKNGLQESESCKEARIHLKGEASKIKVDSIDVVWESGIEPGRSSKLASEQERKCKVHQVYRGQGYSLVPGSFRSSWSNVEQASFVLGLYIFGKNLVQVKRFMDGKTMGDILSFYYGKFFKSDEYRRWSDCRKMRSRRCVYGQRIFTGLRQHELLSRLFLHVSEECQNTLSEVSKTFVEGKMSLEEYVFTLKAIVGMNNLVEAVGIGKGKKDLTGIAVEPLKSNHAVPMRPEMPIGKACSSLSPEEIIKFLTGDFRLSKARSSDLFWEAVWPRLLARGWHSEQPRGEGCGSKHSLVFLLPGVRKFSRKLVKGNHYFDSVSDVLTKVASEPGLLELDAEADESNRKEEENVWSLEAKPVKDDLSERRRPCYLQPRTPNRSSDLMKFTVVDTSLGDRKTCKVRELRSLPLEVSKKTTFESHSEESDRDCSEVSSKDSDSGSADPILFDQDYVNDSNSKKTQSVTGVLPDDKDLKIGSPGCGIVDPGNGTVENSMDISNACDGKQVCSQRRVEEDNLDNLAPVRKKQRKLSSCTRAADITHALHGSSASPGMEHEEQSCCSETTDSSNRLYATSLPRKRVSTTGSLKGRPVKSSRGMLSNTSFNGEVPSNNPQQQTLIDLNLPRVSPGSEAVFASTMCLRDGEDDQTGKKPENCTEPKPCADVDCCEQEQLNNNSRRQGTRNRPPTARALEALASGFLTINRRREKNKQVCTRKSSLSRASQRAAGGMSDTVTESSGPGITSSKMEDARNGGCSDGNSNNMFGKFQVLSEGNAAAQVSGP
ncbi:uncharacterized protein LOC127812045 isoform X2 [Diospyros lotus]|nr:uncharacterized protein LOC127812045 isoform X2 [Diospyros lotus]